MYWTIGLAMDDKTSTPHVTIGPAMRMYTCMKMMFISLFQILVFVYKKIKMFPKN